MSKSTSSQRRPCRLHFSLRELMLLVALLGSLCALLYSRPHQQRRVVDAVRDLGGTVEQSIGDGAGVPVQAKQVYGAWERRILGERFTRVRTIDLSRSRVTDPDLNGMASLHDTLVLDLSHTRIIGSGLSVLRSMPLLQQLDLQSTGVSDASLFQLKFVTQLEDLNLDNTPVSFAGFGELCALRRLRRLSLRNTRINDASLAYLRRLQQLEELYLDNTHVTDAGLAHLQSCVHLQVLSLENTQVTLAGLSQLTSLKQLKDLRASNLDLSVQDLSDQDALEKKHQDSTRQLVVSDRQLLDAIIRTWKDRQDRVRSFDIELTGVESRHNTSFDIRQRCTLDAQGRSRNSYASPNRCARTDMWTTSRP
ncbi:MAG: leucine-rich repeat domain-containing protein [Pirellulaceae bacterium]